MKKRLMVRPVLILLHHDEVQGVPITLLFQLGTVCNHVLLLLQTLVTGKENAAIILILLKLSLFTHWHVFRCNTTCGQQLLCFPFMWCQNGFWFHRINAGIQCISCPDSGQLCCGALQFSSYHSYYPWGFWLLFDGKISQWQWQAMIYPLQVDNEIFNSFHRIHFPLATYVPSICLQFNNPASSAGSGSLLNLNNCRMIPQCLLSCLTNFSKSIPHHGLQFDDSASGDMLTIA